jgi:hypothetical protein
MGTKGLPVNAGSDFKVVPLVYAEVAYESFIWLSVQDNKNSSLCTALQQWCSYGMITCKSS